MRTLVVGDVHGCSAELGELLALARPDRWVSVGDLFTKGPDPGGVARLLGDAPFVLGNHEQRLLDVLDGRHPGAPATHRTIADLDAAAPGWRERVRAAPLWLTLPAPSGPDFVVVHAALHPHRALENTPDEVAVFARRWPGGSDHDPHWDDLYTGDHPVLFGHDAVRGLVYRRREGRPWIVGLDGGCVYGGCLAGYLIEEDAFWVVPARRAYLDVGRQGLDVTDGALPWARST